MWWFLFVAWLPVALAGRPSLADHVLGLLDGDRTARRAHLAAVTDDVATNRVAMGLEIQPFVRDPEVAEALRRWLRRATGVASGDRDRMWQWLWARPYDPHPDYLTFKATLYGAIDPRFAAYFQPDPAPRIRMDEVRWGGVRQDGIPPLRNPRFESVTEATWLDEDDVVFGTVVGGEAAAFPKRILGWHELLTTELGGEAVAVVYCTLCGSAIVYRTEVGGVAHELGTSGFLYRSNKLMFDRATQSLWTTLGGHPVAGPLADRDIGLPMTAIVTTTFGEWRERHPETKVLSLRTGHTRDYGEGAAYREYFATDDLMFTVPTLDRRLANKDEVLALRRGGDTLAIATRFLARRRVYHTELAGDRVVVVTDRSGASRVFEAGALTFVRAKRDRVLDEDRRWWRLTEEALVLDEARRLQRVPAHRAFWFGWRAAWPRTRLVR